MPKTTDRTTLKTTKTKTGAGRPRIDIDPEKVRLLAEAFCTNDEIAAMLGISHDTLTRNFACALKTGRETAKGQLRSQQKTIAMEGNVPMLIWLGKQYLGQSDKSEESGNKTVTVRYDKPPTSNTTPRTGDHSEDPGAF